MVVEVCERLDGVGRGVHLVAQGLLPGVGRRGPVEVAAHRRQPRMVHGGEHVVEHAGAAQAFEVAKVAGRAAVPPGGQLHACEAGGGDEQVDGGGWRVGWYDGKLTNPAVFGDAEDVPF